MNTASNANLTTYTDESNSFSISYPPDWELALSETEALVEEAEEYLESIGSGGTFRQSHLLFFAGIPAAGGHIPNVTVVVEPWQESWWSLEKVAAWAVEGISEDAEEFHELGRIRDTVDGRRVIILEYTATFPGMQRLRFQELLTQARGLLWCVTGAALSEHYAEYEDSLRAILQGLRVAE